jgi:hypothetical protein
MKQQNNIYKGGDAVDFESKKGSADAGTKNPAPRAVVFPNPNQGLVISGQFSQIDSCGVYGVVYSRANVTVQQNTFTGMRHKGVYFGNVNQAKFATYLIQNNTISGDRMTAGVHLINCIRARVLANTLQFTAAPLSFYATGSITRYGIRTEGSSQVQIIDNQVRRTNTGISGVFSNINYLRLQGINVAACPGSTVCNNTLERLGTGMRFMLNNAGIRIRLNKMFTLHTGMNLYQANIQNPGISNLGDDKPSDNQWNNIEGGDATRRIVGTFSASFDYKYRSQSLPNQSSVPAGNWNPQNFTELNATSSGLTFTKTVNNSVQFVTCFGQGVASIAEMTQTRETMFGEIVDGTAQYSGEQEDALRYFDEKTTYIMLKEDSALWATDLSADDKFRNFVTANDTAYIGRLNTVYEYELEGNKQSALQLVESLNTGSDAEYYEKVVGDIYIRRWIQDTASFDTGEIELLMMIAALDYETGGLAVLGARVLLGGDALELEIKNQVLPGEPNAIDSPFIQVYPNPVSDVIGFRINGSPEAFSFRLYTAEGIRVLEQQINEGDLHTGIGVHKLLKGVYFYEIHTRSGKVQNGKLIVITN